MLGRSQYFYVTGEDFGKNNTQNLNEDPRMGTQESPQSYRLHTTNYFIMNWNFTNKEYQKLLMIMNKKLENKELVLSD